MNYIARYEPSRFVNEVSKILEHAFQPINDAESTGFSQWVPAVDIKEDKKQFTISADLPGIDKDKISVAMENNTLTLKGERTELTKEEDSHFSRTERVYGSFYRRFTLPETADESKIEAHMQKGVLEIIIPKKEAAQSRTRAINIKSLD